MAGVKKDKKGSGFGVTTPKVGLYPAGSIVAVRGGKVVTSSERKDPPKKG